VLEAEKMKERRGARVSGTLEEEEKDMMETTEGTEYGFLRGQGGGRIGG